MNIKVKLQWLFYFLAILLILATCSTPGTSSGDSNSKNSLPSGTTEDTDDSSSDGEGIEDTSGGDESDCGNTGDSNDGETSGNSTITKVENFKASELESSNCILLEWTEINNFNIGTDSYKIYRYTPNLNNDDLTPAGMIENIASTPILDNSGISIKTPYFYKIAYIKNGIEGPLSDNYEFGIYTDTIDQYEDKKSISEMEDDDGVTIVGTFPALNGGWKDAIIYSCKDGNESVVTDVDYYKYNGTVTTSLTFEIKLDNESNTDFKDDDIKFRYYYKDVTSINYPNIDYIEGNEHSYVIGASNTLLFEVTNTVDVYFKVYVNNNSVDKTKNIVAKYQVRLTSGM